MNTGFTSCVMLLAIHLLVGIGWGTEREKRVTLSGLAKACWASSDVIDSLPKSIDTRYIPPKESDAPKRITNGDSWTVLTVAIALNQDEMARRILLFGADPSATTRFGYSPIWLLASRHSHDSSSLGLCRKLLAGGANPNCFPTVIVDLPGRVSPLHLSVSRLQPELVELLLAHGADRDARDTSGLRAIDWLERDMYVDDVAQELEEESVKRIREALVRIRD